MRYREYILAGKSRLESARLECADPLLHMKQIVEAGLGIDSSQLILRWESPLTEADHARCERLVERRLTGEPFQYIVGYEDFWKGRFAVGPGVLIPRPETEVLVALALQRLPQGPLEIAELGAGSGVIGISLLGERPWTWHAWESNPASLPYLRQNIIGAANYHLYEGDFFAGVTTRAPVDWWIANPPYVTHSEIPRLSREVRHEPPQALDGGATGLECVTRMIEWAPKHLKPGGGILLEIGSDQGDAVLRLLKNTGFRDATIEKDLAGRDRVAYGRL